MNRLFVNRFSADEITSAIFDATYVDRHRINPGVRLFRAFTRQANPTHITTEKPIPLSEALKTLQSQGMSEDDLEVLYQATIGFMKLTVPNFLILREQKYFPHNHNAIIMHDVDWSPNHYLGVQVRDPFTDFSAEPEILAQVRSDYQTLVQMTLDDLPDMFIRQSKPSTIKLTRHRGGQRNFGNPGYGLRQR